MKTEFNLTAFGLLFTCILQPSSLLAQGSLTPPGAPSPTMKTLQQVEPRVPISTAPFTITQPGSYYLTTNLTVSGGNAITIATNNVMLDLNGFTLSSTAYPAGGAGVHINSGLRNITIQNGFICGGVTNDGNGNFTGPGFGSGIAYVTSPPYDVRVSGISVSGCRYYGINMGTAANALVDRCVVRKVGLNGIVAATILNSLATDTGGTAIYGIQVFDSRGESILGDGLSALTAQNCYGQSPDYKGLYARTALNCMGVSTTDYGLYAERAALNCLGYSSSGYGLYAGTALNCYGESSSATGLAATRLAFNCHGFSASGTGLSANSNAQNCYGESQSGPRGLYAVNASFCTGYRPGGQAIAATLANGCWAAAGTNFITYKYNMP